MTEASGRHMGNLEKCCENCRWSYLKPWPGFFPCSDCRGMARWESEEETVEEEPTMEEVDRLKDRIRRLERWREGSDKDLNELFVEKDEMKRWQKEIDDWANVVGDDFDRILERLANLEGWRRDEAGEDFDALIAAANASQEDIQKLKEWQEDHEHLGSQVAGLNKRCFKLSEENGLQNEKIAMLEARLDALEGRGIAKRQTAQFHELMNGYQTTNLEPEERVLDTKFSVSTPAKLEKALIRAAKGEMIKVGVRVGEELVIVRMEKPKR